MQNVQAIEAAILELMEEMRGDQGDPHEILMRLRQILARMRATGMPIPDDLAEMERRMAAEFESEAKR